MPARPSQEFDPAFDVALDVAMLERALPSARTWVPAGTAVVIGVASRVDEEVLRRPDIVVRRRSSGGSAVLLTPGTVCFAVVMPMDWAAGVDTIGGSYEAATRPVIEALASVGADARLVKPGDLACGDRKVCGLAQSRRRDAVLVHGVIPVRLAPGELEAFLLHPPREPDYRRGRPHSDFVADLFSLCGVESSGRVADALDGAFEAAGFSTGADDWCLARAGELAAGKFGRDEWTFRR